MDSPTELERKYRILATEYSKIRSQAGVLKKAVIDEQESNLVLTNKVKKLELQLRKHSQEMESVNFRNEQLTKRITVLQQDLQVNNKKGKQKNSPSVNQTDMSVLDEEFEKKIIENAQLVSSMADKEIELLNCNEKITWLESKLASFEKESHQKEVDYIQEISQLKIASYQLEKKMEADEAVSNSSKTIAIKDEENLNSWKEKAERWQAECEILRAKPQSNQQLTEYYESQLREILDTKQVAQSENKTLWAENQALYTRLENLISKNKTLETSSENSNEEYLTIIENYRSQLDAMTEHLAAQNDKITKQCDQIQELKHKNMSKK